MHCGQALAAPRTESPVAVHAVTPAAPAKNKWFWPAVIGLLIAIGMLVSVASFLMAKAKTTGPGLQAAATTPTAPLTTGYATMPPDIRAWLDHLRETEDRKNKLVNDQSSLIVVEFTKLNNLGAATGALDNNGNLDPENMRSPSEVENEKLKALRPAWRDLIQFFESMPPPPECTDLAHTYDRALDEVSGEIGDLGDILSGSQTDPTKAIQTLTNLQGKSAPIDQSFSLSDSMVGQICDKYHTAKWFSIKADAGSPLSMGGAGGLLPH